MPTCTRVAAVAAAVAQRGDDHRDRRPSPVSARRRASPRQSSCPTAVSANGGQRQNMASASGRRERRPRPRAAPAEHDQRRGERRGAACAAAARG